MSDPDLFDHAADRARAARLRDAGIAQSVEHADAKVPEWRDVAYRFLLEFCRSHDFFISEDVSNTSKEADFPQPPTDRAWGHVYRRAAKEGKIIQVGIGRSNRRHRSICPRWQSLIFKGAA